MARACAALFAPRKIESLSEPVGRSSGAGLPRSGSLVGRCTDCRACPKDGLGRD